MTDLSIVNPCKIACRQKVDFPEPGGPTNKIRFLAGISCIWDRDTNNYPTYQVVNARLFELRLVSKQHHVFFRPFFFLLFFSAKIPKKFAQNLSCVICIRQISPSEQSLFITMKV
jgi:hypothetical protein